MSDINNIDEIIGTAIDFLVDRKTSPNTIKNQINKKFKMQFVVKDISDHIKEKLNKVWISHERIYKEIQTSAATIAEVYETYVVKSRLEDTVEITGSCNESHSTLESSIKDEKMVPVDTLDISLPFENKGPSNAVSNEIEDTDIASRSKLDDIIDYLQELNKKVGTLEASNRSLTNRLAETENLIKEMRLENPYKQVQLRGEELIAIYSCDNSKKNVNINPKINEMVVQLMADKFKIRNNNAQAINLALLIALYRSGLATI